MPFGPVRVDVGFPLKRARYVNETIDTTDPRVLWHFSLGHILSDVLGSTTEAAVADRLAGDRRGDLLSGYTPHLMALYVQPGPSRHLLRIEEGGLRVRDFQVRNFEGLDLYGVSLTLPANPGGLTLISADTVTVDFGFREVLGTVPHFRRVEVARPEIYSMAGTDTTAADPSGNPELNLPELMIDHLVIREAFLEFSDSGGRLVERIPRLDLQAERGPALETRAVLRGVDIDWETHASTLNDLRGNVVVDAEGIRGDEFSGRFNGHHVAGRGGRFWERRYRCRGDCRGHLHRRVGESPGSVHRLHGCRGRGWHPYQEGRRGPVHRGLFRRTGGLPGRRAVLHRHRHTHPGGARGHRRHHQRRHPGRWRACSTSPIPKRCPLSWKAMSGTSTWPRG